MSELDSPIPVPVVPNEVLFRQVHPSFIPDGVVQSNAFKPTLKDEGKLSVSLASLTSAEDAYLHHTVFLGKQSAGVWALTGQECIDNGTLGFHEAEPNNHAHGFIDFRGKSKKQIENAAKTLKNHANRRGAVFVPESTTLPPPP
jgi:hypothetical protein